MLIPLVKVMEELAVSRTTVIRWVRNGFMTPTGEVVRLKAMRAGKGWRVRREDLKVFLAACEMPQIEPEITRPIGAGRRAKG